MSYPSIAGWFPRVLAVVASAATLAGCIGDGTSSVSDPANAAAASSTASAVSDKRRVRTGLAISGTPSTTDPVGVAYSFVPTVSGSSHNSLTFSIANRPAWASFSSVTGALSGVPGPAQAGSYAGIVISVSDGTSSASLPPFTITVSVPPGTGPTISGTPAASVTAGLPYAFTPTASDPNNLPLTFSVTNKPAWASFSSSTGALTGTPAATDVGTFANVSISVSDGSATTSLAPFTITVQPPTLGSATLSWVPPTLRIDGTPLTNLAGYHIYYGTTAGSYTSVISVANPGLTSYVITSLPPGTYYFAATAYDSSGMESAYSTPASKTI
jgi:hypothetical protein